MTRDEEAIEAMEQKRRRRQARGVSVVSGALPVVRVDAAGRVVGEFDL